MSEVIGLLVVAGAGFVSLVYIAMPDHMAGKLRIWRRKRRSPEIRKLHAAKRAVDDMVSWKEQRRIEERQKWATEFEALSAEPDAIAIPEPVKVERHPEPPRGPGSVSRPLPDGMRIVSSDGGVILERRRPERISVQIGGLQMVANPVRMGKWVGYYVVHDTNGDALLDTDHFTILKTYADGHYSTCPYECDCPDWARRA